MTIIDVKIFIRKNSTGEIRCTPQVLQKSETEEERPEIFWWSEGNGACDCSRSDFFARAKGEPEPEDAPCGSSMFSIKIEQDGKTIYSEF